MKKIEFKSFLLNEDKAYLGQKIGDILNALQELAENGKAMGTRQLIKNSEAIVNQVRRVLHSDWQKEEEKYLKPMQKVAVAIMRAIEEKDDLQSILSSASEELGKVHSDLGAPALSLGTPDDKLDSPDDEGEKPGVRPSEGPEKHKSQQGKQPTQASAQPPADSEQQPQAPEQQQPSAPQQ